MTKRVKVLQQQLKALDTDPSSPSTRVQLLNDLSWELRHTDMRRAYRLANEAWALLEQGMLRRAPPRGHRPDATPS